MIWRGSKNSARGGFGLLDMVGMLTLIGTLLSFSAIILNRAFSTHRSAMEHLAVAEHLNGAHERWIRDAHAATRYQVGVELELWLTSGQKILYRQVDGRLVRTMSESTTDAESFVDVGQDEWLLPAGCEVSWALDREQDLPLLLAVFQVPDREPIHWVTRAEANRHPLVAGDPQQ